MPGKIEPYYEVVREMARTDTRLANIGPFEVKDKLYDLIIEIREVKKKGK